MSGIVLILQVIIIVVSIVSLLKHYSNRGEKSNEAKEAYRIKKASGQVEEAEEEYIEKAKELHSTKKKLKNELVEVVGVYSESVLEISARGARSQSIDQFIGDFRIKAPKHVKFSLTKEYNVKGIFDGSILYLTEVDGEFLADDANMKELERVRDLSKEESIYFASNTKGILAVILLIVSSLVPIWYRYPMVYIGILAVILVIILIPLKNKSVSVYAIEGEYRLDGEMYESIGGVPVSGVGKEGRSVMAYEQGEYVEAEGILRDIFQLTKYRGFSLYAELSKVKKNIVVPSTIAIIFMVVMSIFTWSSKGLTKYKTYMKVKDMDAVYTSLDRLNEEVVVGQYVDLNNFFFYPIISEGRTTESIYVLEKDDRELAEYRNRMKHIDRKVAEHRAYLKNIDFNIAYRSSEEYEEMESYVALREVYFAQDTEPSTLMLKYYDFVDAIVDKLNEDLDKLEEDMKGVYESNFAVKNSGINMAVRYYRGYSNTISPTGMIDIVNLRKSEKMKGIVTEVHEKDGKKYIGIDRINSYDGVEDEKQLYYVIIAQLFMALVFTGVIAKEVMRAKSYR